MNRPSFRSGLALGLLGGALAAVAKMAQGRRELPEAPAPSTDWPPLAARPTAPSVPETIPVADPSTGAPSTGATSSGPTSTGTAEAPGGARRASISTADTSPAPAPAAPRRKPEPIRRKPEPTFGVGSGDDAGRRLARPATTGATPAPPPSGEGDDDEVTGQVDVVPATLPVADEAGEPVGEVAPPPPAPPEAASPPSVVPDEEGVPVAEVEPPAAVADAPPTEGPTEAPPTAARRPPSSGAGARNSPSRPGGAAAPAARTAAARSRPAVKRAPATPPAEPEPTPAPPAKAKAKAKKAPAKRAPAKRAPVEPWVAAGAGGTCPGTHPIKAKLSSRIFHLPGMFAYDRTNADRCYVDEAAALADGLRVAKR